ncbi:unnamed protein product [Trichogramma brassicae]|uniref:Reverse transcriptase domain-containing protein n=1 Tax=Trichogramma brassicae TaxID=86971 RepID=A0A6H5I6L9_9HYME|nr:unnamed protein product [Trichogramma brassicae]
MILIAVCLCSSARSPVQDQYHIQFCSTGTKSHSRPFSKITRHTIKYFEARMKMDRNVSSLARKQRIFILLSELGLIKCSKTKLSKLSCGERKRVSLAVQLLIEPRVLFCDEPTTGLDSFAAMTVTKTLRDVAARGFTIPTFLQSSMHFSKSARSVAFNRYGLNCMTASRSGVFPRCWKRQRLVLLPKPGKPPDKPTSFRPICMLDAMGKMLERIICDRLQAFTESPAGLSDRQFGFRRGRSTIDAIETVVSTAREALKGKRWLGGTKEYCAVVTLDVKNAFNTARWNNILTALERIETPAYLLKIIANYFQDRVLEFGTSDGPEVGSVTAGVPQGSVLGPTLWNVMYDAILRLNLQRSVNIVGFADDIALVAVGKYLWQIENHLNAAVGQVREALLRLGLETADQKTEVLLLTSRKKMESITITVGNCHIKSAPHIRYLGLHIDARLRFDVHLAKASEKTRSVAGALASIMPRTGGPRSSRRKLYAGVVDSVLLYGAPIWSSATETRAYLRQAESIHRRACLRIISGRPHLSYEATYVLASIPPLALLVDERARLFHRSRDDADRGDERQETLRRWQVQWDQSTKGRWTHRLVPDIKEWVERRHGEMSYHLTQLLSGHGYFRHNSQRYDNNASARCPVCPDETENVEHVFFHCSRFEPEREVLQAQIGERTEPENIVRLMLRDRSNWNAVSNFAKTVKWICDEFEKSMYGERVARSIEESCFKTTYSDIPHPIFSIGLLPASEFKRVRSFCQLQWLLWRTYVDYKRNISSIFLRFCLYMNYSQDFLYDFVQLKIIAWISTWKSTRISNPRGSYRDSTWIVQGFHVGHTGIPLQKNMTKIQDTFVIAVRSSKTIPEVPVTRVESAAMCDGQREQQAPKSAHDDGAMSRSKSGSLLPLPTKIRSSPSMNAAATTRRILAAPLVTTKDAPLPTLADFATGSVEEKRTRIEGLVKGLAKFIEPKGNLHKEIGRYTASLVQAVSAFKKMKKSLEPAPPPTADKAVCTSPIFSPKPRPAQRKVHHRPDAIFIKAKDASTYADILQTLKSEPTLQQSVGSSVQNIRRSAAGALVLQLRKNVDNASTLGAELGKVLGDAATASALQHTTMIEIRDLDECTTKDEIAEALSTSLSAPHLNKHVIKTLRKASAETQAAVAKFPDDLVGKALKLGHIWIGWVNCRIRGREDTLRCYRCWSSGHVSARCKGPDRSAHCLRCGQTGHLIKNCKENPTCVGRWLADANSQAAIWVQGSGGVQERPARARPFFTWARINGIYFFSVYAPPRLADVEYSALLTNIIEEVWDKRPLIVAGDFNAWSNCYTPVTHQHSPVHWATRSSISPSPATHSLPE